jgi:hypothetical protein
MKNSWIAAGFASAVILAVSAGSAFAKAYQGYSAGPDSSINGKVSGTYGDSGPARAARRSATRQYGSRSRTRYSNRRTSGRRSASRRNGSSRRYSSGRSAKRSFVNYARAGGGASTGCLTSAARNLLGRIRSRFGNVQVISTCRAGARIAGTGKPSKHASGQAIDFRVPGRKGEVISWLRANHRSGGIMTYNDMDHIHVDIGSRFVALGRPSGRT